MSARERRTLAFGPRCQFSSPCGRTKSVCAISAAHQPEAPARSSLALRAASSLRTAYGSRSAVERGRGDADVQAKAGETVAFDQRAVQVAGRSGPIVVLHTDGQVVLLIEVHHAAVKAELPAAVVGVDRLDPDATLSVVVILGSAHECFVD